MGSDVTLNVGFDDTDSPAGMCTTYLAYVIAGSLRKEGAAEFLDYPRLVRFNPNVPWKTRGNGAVSMRVRTGDPGRVKNEIRRTVFERADVAHGANPGLVFWEGDDVPEPLAGFGRLALWQLISRPDARRFARDNGLEIHYMGNGQGLVGAIGATGYRWDDHTMELLSYRRAEMCGTRRVVSPASVKSMQDRTFPSTFNSYDERSGRVLITPRGPDPVFYGIRGEDAASLVAASRMIRSDESPLGYMIFRTNQGTGAHLRNELTEESMRPFASGWIRGAVTGSPIAERGGHVFFEVESGGRRRRQQQQRRRRVRCAVYKPTKMTGIARRLVAGDEVRVGGGVRKASKGHQRALNAEYIEVISLADDSYLANPTCPACGKRMKSKGVGQGFECVRCEDSRAASKVEVKRNRAVRTGLYIPDAGAQRHLTRPVQRLERRNRAGAPDHSLEWLHVYDNSGE
ncbi:MAG: DUF1743 domain-containing protein [Nitrosopumilaceae archaeon]|nr:DUF1743 domain-containing protein [Nitrosopumilaceae archaeon]